MRGERSAPAKRAARTVTTQNARPVPSPSVESPRKLAEVIKERDALRAENLQLSGKLKRAEKTLAKVKEQLSGMEVVMRQLSLAQALVDCHLG